MEQRRIDVRIKAEQAKKQTIERAAPLEEQQPQDEGIVY